MGESRERERREREREREGGGMGEVSGIDTHTRQE